MTVRAARSAPEKRASDDETAPTRSGQDCLVKAAELECQAADAPEGAIRDGFLEMADDWRRLAAANPPLVNIWR